MWWEILPSMTLVGMALSLQHLLMFGSNYVFNGNGYKRQLVDSQQIQHYWRDTKLSNWVNPYLQKTLREFGEDCEPKVEKEKEKVAEKECKYD